MSVLGSFDRRYRRWNRTNAAVLILLSGVILAFPRVGNGGLAAGAYLLIGLWGAAALLRLYRFGRSMLPTVDGTGRADFLTAIRGGAATMVLVVLGTAGETLYSAPSRWVLVVFLALAETTDFFDGRVARRRGPSRFGATWDMENDAFFTAALSHVVLLVSGAEPIFVLIGLMRYLYVLILPYHSAPPHMPAVYKGYAKVVAAATAVTQIVVLAPVIPAAVRTTALTVVLILLVISFAWDLLLHRRSDP
jgi:phosphatidylglycerophosphate synthase